MKRRHVATTLLIGSAVLALGACSSSSKSSTGTTPTSPETTAPATTAASTPPAANPTLKTAANSTLGQVIVDATGKTVYLYVPDGSATTSKVPASLKTAWPPVVVSGAVIAGTGLSAGKLARNRQADGAQQVAYNGHLLYTFAGDKGPGDAGGQGLGGIWYALTPAGDKAS